MKELEEFAFRGCPNLNKPSILNDLPDHELIIQEQRIKQKELIDQLKSQLEDLETYAYQVILKQLLNQINYELMIMIDLLLKFISLVILKCRQRWYCKNKEL